MPSVNWKKISELKHAIAQERTVLCGMKIRLHNLKVSETIQRLDMCDKRLAKLESQIVDIIEEGDNEL